MPRAISTIREPIIPEEKKKPQQVVLLEQMEASLKSISRQLDSVKPVAQQPNDIDLKEIESALKKMIYILSSMLNIISTNTLHQDTMTWEVIRDNSGLIKKIVKHNKGGSHA